MNGTGILNSSLTKKYVNIILPLFIGSVLAYLDRLNIAYAALTMNQDLGFTAKVFGMGAGILFWGYVLFEVPGTLIAHKWSPRKWIARIMITWGISCALMAFIQNEMQFYILRFLIGAAEASFYPVCYAVIIPRWFNVKERATAISIMLTSLLVSNIIGSPLAGMLLDLSWMGLKGWQMLFLIEGGIAFIFGFIIPFWLADWPKDVALPMFIGAIGMGWGSVVTHPILSFVLVCITAIGVYVGMGVWWTYPTSFLSGAAAAGAVSLINSVGNLGGWTGPYLVGFLKDLTGTFTWAYLYLAFSLAAAGLLILTLRKKLPTDHMAVLPTYGSKPKTGTD
jgi:MFS family permease